MNEVLAFTRCAECREVGGPVRLHVGMSDARFELYTDTPDGWHSVRYVGDICAACSAQREGLDRR